MSIPNHLCRSSVNFVSYYFATGKKIYFSFVLGKIALLRKIHFAQMRIGTFAADFDLSIEITDSERYLKP